MSGSLPNDQIANKPVDVTPCSCATLRTSPQTLAQKMITISNAPQDSREFIYAAALEMHQILQSYVQTHDEVFGFSLRKVIPLPFIFKKMDFQSLYEQCRFREREIKEVVDQLPATSSEAPELLESLKVFSQALFATVEKLEQICGKLWDKAEKKKVYSPDEYNRDVAEYNHLVASYQEAGHHLNLQINAIG